jgi:hypothetical protein
MSCFKSYVCRLIMDPCDENLNHAIDVPRAKEWDSPSVGQESF